MSCIITLKNLAFMQFPHISCSMITYIYIYIYECFWQHIPKGDWFCPDCKPKETKRSPLKQRRRTFTEDASEDEDMEDEQEEEEER